MQKIKDALTPGHHHHTTTTTPGTTYNPNTGYTANDYMATGGMLGGQHTAGQHTTVARDSSTYSSSSSEGGFVQHTNVAGTTCNVREFAEVEDRPVVKERVERIVEHVPVEKKFEVVTRAVGETVLSSNTTVESLGVTERVIEVAKGTTCPTVGTVERVVGGGAATTTYDRCHGGNC